jgi:hypothetical protein
MFRSYDHLQAEIYCIYPASNQLTHRPTERTKHFFTNLLKKLNSVVCVRERTIPTERPPLVGEVSANFRGIEVAT